MLRIEGLRVSFGRIRAVRRLDLTVDPGEVVALVGANGAGKTTAARTASGVVRPSAGVVEVEGRPIAGLSTREIVRRGVTLVPQGRQLFRSMTVRENIELGGYAHGGSDAKEHFDRCVTLFPEVGKRLDVSAGSLSGGQQQIVALVRGLMARPRLLMLDEPSIGIAPMVLKRIADELRKMAQDSGIGILLIEQNIAFARSVATRCVVMTQGQDVYNGDPALLDDYDSLTRHFFGSALETPVEPARPAPSGGPGSSGA